MGAAHLEEVMGWVFFIQDNVGHKTGPAVNPLKQIMAEQGVIRDTPREAALEGVHLIDTFADIDTFVK